MTDILYYMASVILSYLTFFFFFFLLDEGYYQGGKFQFEIEVPDAYNMVVSICL